MKRIAYLRFVFSTFRSSDPSRYIETAIRIFEILKIILYPSSSKTTTIYLSTRILEILSYFQTNFHAVNEFSNENFIPDRDGGKQETFPSKLIRSKTCSNWRVQLESSDRREYKFPPKQAVAKKEGARRAVSIRNPSPWREITPLLPFPAVSIREKGGLQFSCHPRHEEKHFPGKLERRWGEIGGDGVRWKGVSPLLLAATETLLFSSLPFSCSLCSLTPECASYFSIPLPSFHGRGVCLRPTLCARLPFKNVCNPVARGLKKRANRVHLVASRERETLIFVNRRAWSSSTFGKNLSTYILCPFSSPLRSTFLVFPTFQTIVSKCGNFQLGGEALLPHPSRFGKIERSVLVPVVGRGGFVRVARSPMRAYISLSGNMEL